MDSPPPEPSDHVSDDDRLKNTPSRSVVPTTPTKQKPLMQHQLPTPSYLPQDGGLVVTWDTKFGNIKRRLVFTKDGPVPCPAQGPLKPAAAASIAGNPAFSQPTDHKNHERNNKPTRPYSIIQRNHDLASAKAWLSSAATDEQRQQRTDAIITAIFQGSSNKSFGKRKLRTKRPERDDDCSSDSDLYSDSESGIDNNDVVLDGKRTTLHEQSQSKPQKYNLWTPSAVPKDDSALPAPKIGQVGIQNAEDLQVITQFRQTHNPVLASIRTGKVVLPYCGGAAPGPRGRSWRSYDQQQKQDDLANQEGPPDEMETSALSHTPDADKERSDASAPSSGIKDTAITDISDDDQNDEVDHKGHPRATIVAPQHRITKYPPKRPQAALPAGTKAAELEQRQNKRIAAKKKRRGNNKNKKTKGGGSGGDPKDKEFKLDPFDSDCSTQKQDKDDILMPRKPSRRLAFSRAARGQGTGTLSDGGGAKKATATQKSMLVVMKRPRAKKPSTGET